MTRSWGPIKPVSPASLSRANYKNGIVSHAVAALTGARHGALPGAVLNTRRADMHKLIFAELARRMGARVERFWKAEGKTGAAVAYIWGVVMVNDA